jgi:hypothetical protein
MKGGDADNQDITDFILTRPINYLRLTANPRKIAVARVLMTHRHNTGSRLAQ